MLEGTDPRLLDRLNTLVFLEKNRRADPARWFFSRIARQTHFVLAKPAASPHSPVSPSRSLIHLGIFAALLAATIFIYHKYSPWQHLLAADAERKAKTAAVQKPAELALPTNNVAEENKVWGEVRITDPARDLKVTKVDVVPLQIEAAASQSLKQVAWFSTVNGTEEKPHELPPPAEPRYAVYQPTLYLDELRLADWDVLTYYASAHTDKGDGYASEVYFIEVRPFREDILKLPGGEGGKAYQCLNELTALIERQQHIIRQTHQYQQAPDDQAKLREQDRHKLADAEDDEGDSVRHLYAKMSTEMENQPIGEALDNLAKAERPLDDASKSLLDDIVKQAQNQERDALTDLIAARKMFQKALSEHPDAFKDKPEERDPMAGSSKKLSDIAEFRNEAKAAEDFVQKAVEQQHKLADKAGTAPRPDQPKLADEESKLQKSLADFEQQHPQVFHQVTNETAAADQSLKHAATSLQNKAKDVRPATQTAAEDLEKLAAAMQGQAAGRELSDAYKLKQLLDEEIEKMKQFQQATNEIPSTNRQQATAESRETLKQLKQLTESKPMTNAFSPALHESLSGTNKSALDSQLIQLENAQGKDDQHQAAGEAQHGLEKVSEAFNSSQPSTMKAAQKHDSLKPGSQESFERGMNELESLKQSMEKNGHPMSAAQSSKLRQDAFSNLQQALADLYGHDDRAKQLMLLLDQELNEKGSPPDGVTLKKLMDELRNFSVEVADKPDKQEHPDLTNIDPSRLPPAYRGRIEKYYQKLSDQKP